MDKQKMTTLVHKAQSGSQAARNELMTEFYQPLYYYILKCTKNEDLAYDITQESCIQIMTQLSQLRAPEAFSTWAYTIAKNLVYKHHTDAAREVPLTPLDDDSTILDSLPDETPGSLPEQVCQDKEFQQTMQNMLDNLPTEQRTAMLLYYYEKLSVRDIAAIQGTTEGTVKSRLNYGRKAVKQQVEDYEKKNNVKLHSISILPLLYFLFGKGAEETAKTTAIVLPALGGTAAAAATGGLAAKVVGIALAVALTGGAVAGVVALTQPEDSQEDSYVQNQDEEEDVEVTESDPTQPEILEEVGLQYRLNADGQSYSVVGLVDWEEETLVIPGTFNGLPVTKIADRAFFNSFDVIHVEISEGITEIGKEAFAYCGSLKSVHLPQSLKTIDEYAFAHSALEDIRFPDTMERIGAFAFQRTNLTELVLPEGITAIEQGTFCGCYWLESITFPSTLREICDAEPITEEFDGEEVINYYGAFGGCDALQNLVIPGHVKVIGSYAFTDIAPLTEVVLEEGVEEIHEHALGGLEVLHIPVSVVVIQCSVDQWTAHEIYYGGTTSQWYAFQFDRSTRVYCSDGTVLEYYR